MAYKAVGLPVTIPAWTKIREQTLIATIDTVTFNGLDLDRDGSYKLLLNMEVAGGAVTVRLYYNNDLVDANYYNQYLTADAGVVAGGRTNDAMISRVEADLFSTCEVTVMRPPGNYTRALAQTSRYAPATIGFFFLSHIWNVLSNVTRIDIVLIGGTVFAAGSTFKLFKLALG